MPIFLRIPDVPGDAETSGYENTIVIEDMEWGLSSPGGSKADASFADITMAKSVDRASTHIALACAAGTAFGPTVIHVVETGELLREFLTINLTTPRVTAFFQNEDLEEEPPQESMALNYEKIEVIYKPVNPDGTPGPEQRFAWDLVKNKPF